MANPFPANFEGLDGSRRLTGQVNFTDPANQPGGGGGVTPPVVITGTDPTTIPLTVQGAAGESDAIIKVLSNDNSVGLTVQGDGANSLGSVSMSGPNFGGLNLTPNGTSVLSADTDVVHLSGSASGGFILSAFNAAPPDASLGAGDLALWLDPTNGAAKLMIKAKSANGTVVTGFVVLA